jgi:hypothetical protein
MRSSLISLICASALAATLASCSVNPASAFCGPLPIKNAAVPQLIYPVPGYAKVPATQPFIVVAYPAAPELAQTITITSAHGGTVALGPLGAAPKTIPTPHAKVLPGQGAEYGVTLPALTADTTYTVNYRFANTANACGQSTTTNDLMGTFTTQ